MDQTSKNAENSVATVLAVSGGIGAGKSSVVNDLMRRSSPDSGAMSQKDSERIAGAVICKSADGIVHEILANPKHNGVREIADAFGRHLLLPDGAVDRVKLAQLVFNDTEQRRLLEGILHPLVRQAFVETIQSSLTVARLIVLEIPLLFETGMYKSFAHNWLVAAPEELRIQRVMVRDNVPAEEVRARIRAQMPEKDKRLLATQVIENAGTEEQMHDAITQALRKINVL